jgi:hypothetical protein
MESSASLADEIARSTAYCIAENGAGERVVKEDRARVVREAGVVLFLIPSDLFGGKPSLPILPQ